MEGHAAWACAAGGAFDEQQVGGEQDGRGDFFLGVPEEGGVDAAGAVVDADEDDAFSASHGRGLGGDPDPRDEDCGAVAQGQEVLGFGEAERFEERLVGVDEVVGDVQCQDVQFFPGDLQVGKRRGSRILSIGRQGC